MAAIKIDAAATPPAGPAQTRGNGRENSAAEDGTCPDTQRHPLSAAFGDMPAREFAELVRDIKRNGLIVAIVKADDGRILDGWHRYRACIRAGVVPRFEPFNCVVQAAAEGAGRTMAEAEFVVAQNAHRRHLTSVQRRAIVAAMLKAAPQRSNATVAAATRVSDKTVAAVRATLESTSEIPKLAKTTGRDGKARPSKNTKPVIDHRLTAALPVGGAHATDVAAPSAKPRALGSVVWRSSADRQRVLKALDVGAVALRRLARVISFVRRTEVELARAKLLAAVAELDRMLEAAP